MEITEDCKLFVDIRKTTDPSQFSKFLLWVNRDASLCDALLLESAKPNPVVFALKPGLTTGAEYHANFQGGPTIFLNPDSIAPGASTLTITVLVETIAHEFDHHLRAPEAAAAFASLNDTSSTNSPLDRALGYVEAAKGGSFELI